ncbi:hypothetical protein [Embleya scabrispora]|nr:hypothetical protein [Embleya scabrispora]
MHDTHDSTPSLADLKAAREAATAAVKEHAAASLPNGRLPDAEDATGWETWREARAGWGAEWQRLLQAERDAAVAVHQARQATGE